MKKINRILSALILLATLLTSCSSGSNSIFISLAIVVEPVIGVYDIGRTAQYKAYALRLDDEWVEVTDEVAWTTNDPAVADISESGLLTALAVGRTGVIATLENNSGIAVAVVEEKSLPRVTVDTFGARPEPVAQKVPFTAPSNQHIIP